MWGITINGAPLNWWGILFFAMIGGAVLLAAIPTFLLWLHKRRYPPLDRR